MRIALICPYSCTVPGGVQTQVLGLARALSSCGDEVAVLAPAEEQAQEGRLDSASLNGASFLRVGSGIPVSVNGSRAPVSPWPSTMSRTLAALRAFRPEIVHVHEPFVPGPSLAAVLRGPRPIVATFHHAGEDPAYRAFGHLLGAFSTRIDEAFAVSEEAATTARHCVAHLPEHLDIITNGIEVERLSSVKPWPARAPTVVFVGRHEARKGLEVLLEAFSRLPASTRLWALGDGPETVGLRARFGSNPHIEWPGPVGDTERARRLKGADVFVAPSLGGESFGLVLLEAMAAGAAVLASDLPGYRLAATGAAHLVPPGNVQALADAMADLLGDEGARRELREKGLRRARECDMATVADTYRDVFARLRCTRRE